MVGIGLKTKVVIPLLIIVFQLVSLNIVFRQVQVLTVHFENMAVLKLVIGVVTFAYFSILLVMKRKRTIH